MSYKTRLCLTHLMTAVVTACCVAFGPDQSVPTRIGLILLAGAGIAGPGFVAFWWVKRALRQMESNLTEVRSNSAVSGSGLPEIDGTTERLLNALERQRSLVQNVDALMVCLGHSRTTEWAETGKDDADLVTTAMGTLARTTAREVVAIMGFCDEIARSAHDTSWGAQEQVRTVETAISAVESLSAMIGETGHDAMSAARDADEAAAKTGQGLELMQQMIRGMQDIQSNVAICEKKITALGQQSEQISAIVETMGNISARTDMLALNASIEAVRAGQEGRGFSVVAEEVRKLADSTAAASRDIAALVAAIRSEGHETLAAMMEERHQVRKEILRVSDAARSLENIRSTATASAERSRHIIDTTPRQLQKVQDVVRAMQQMSAVADRITERGDAIRHKTTDLIEKAQVLEESLAPMYHLGESEELPADHRIGGGQRSAVARRRGTQEPGDELVAAARRGEFAR